MCCKHRFGERYFTPGGGGGRCTRRYLYRKCIFSHVTFGERLRQETAVKLFLCFHYPEIHPRYNEAPRNASKQQAGKPVWDLTMSEEEQKAAQVHPESSLKLIKYNFELKDFPATIVGRAAAHSCPGSHHWEEGSDGVIKIPVWSGDQLPDWWEQPSSPRRILSAKQRLCVAFGCSVRMVNKLVN